MIIGARKIVDDFTWVGALDPDLRVFDIVMRTDFGTTYNSYVLKGTDKTALFEANKSYCFDEWIERIREVTPVEKIDYLVVSHTEPDHCGTVDKLLELNPDIEIIGTMGAINFLKEILNRDDFKCRAVKEGEEIELGGKTMRFIVAPNLHWPDTMFTYVPEIATLVTCDCFGCHFSDPGITDENLCNNFDYMKSLLYYYEGIMSPFCPDVQNALAKIDPLKIDIIATGHGPVLTDNPGMVIELYRQWSRPAIACSCKMVVIAYVSAYGYTKNLAEAIRDGIAEASNGNIEVRMFDMVGSDFDEVMKAITLSDGFLLGTPTIVGEAVPPIWDIAAALNPKVHGGKLASAFGSYGWSGEGVPHIMQRLGQVKLKLFGEGYRCRFNPSGDQLAAAKEFGHDFAGELIGKSADD